METLLTLAKKSFAEIKAAFSGSAEAEIIIDQEPGIYQVRVRFDDNPAKPAVWIERRPKPDLASILIGEQREFPMSLRRCFNAALSNGSRFGWLERSVSEPPLDSAGIIGIVRGLL